MTSNYNPWPLGKLPEHWIRPEISWAREKGLFKDDPREIVSIFEDTIASFVGSKFAVAVDCCSHGIFLCLQYLLRTGSITSGHEISIPKRTYASVPMQIIHSGLKVVFDDRNWSGIYELTGSNIVDAAGRFTAGMFRDERNVQVLSFQIKKILPIGRGGMILTDDEVQYEWLKKARHDGRDLSIPYDSPSHIEEIGWHFYMTPEDAARGLYLFSQVPSINEDCMNSQMYPSLDQWNIWEGI